MTVECMTYLAGVLATFGKSGANEAGRDWLEVGAVAVLVAPHRKVHLALHGALLSAVVGGAPPHHRGPLPHERVAAQRQLGQADGRDVLGALHRPVQPQQRDVVVEADPREARVRLHLHHLIRLRLRRLVVAPKVHVAQPHRELTCAEPEYEQ